MIPACTLWGNYALIFKKKAYFCTAFCNIMQELPASCDGELSKNELNLE